MTPERFNELKTKSVFTKQELSEIFIEIKLKLDLDVTMSRVFAECAFYRDTLQAIKDAAKQNLWDAQSAVHVCGVALDSSHVGTEWLNTLQKLSEENRLMKELLGRMIDYCKTSETFKEEYVN